MQGNAKGLSVFCVSFPPHQHRGGAEIGEGLFWMPANLGDTGFQGVKRSEYDNNEITNGGVSPRGACFEAEKQPLNRAPKRLGVLQSGSSLDRGGFGNASLEHCTCLMSCH